jgi:hypothetical protein
MTERLLRYFLYGDADFSLTSKKGQILIKVGNVSYEASNVTLEEALFDALMLYYRVRAQDELFEKITK